MKDIRIIEVTKENEKRYLEGICDLENYVLSNMEQQGKVGQLFITGREDIDNYIRSKENTIMIAIDKQDNVIAATYITQGQKAFSYNDITKYFKVSSEYKEYVKEQYPDEMSYKKDVLEAYELKMRAYLYARNKILQEFKQYSSIGEFLQEELSSEGQFDEKSVLREKIISYMSEYIENIGNREDYKKYEYFFWMTAEDVEKIVYGNNKKGRKFNSATTELEDCLQLQEEHQNLLQKASLKIYERPEFEQRKYFTANSKNSIEIDTYITDPRSRNNGLARILIYEGIKKHIPKITTKQDIFLCSTLHRDNLSSKYVSEFFGLKDSLFVKRRQGRDREVHITKVKQEDIDMYLRQIQEKLTVLYGYRENEIYVPTERKKEIIKEQLKYEKQEYKRLNGIRHNSKNYTGHIKNMYEKAYKIQNLKTRLANVEKEDLSSGGDVR